MSILYLILTLFHSVQKLTGKSVFWRNRLIFLILTSKLHYSNCLSFRNMIIVQRFSFTSMTKAEMCNRNICLYFDYDYDWIIKKKVRLRLRLRLVVNYAKNRLRLRLCNRLVIDWKSIAFSIKLKNLEWFFIKYQKSLGYIKVRPFLFYSQLNKI